MLCFRSALLPDEVFASFLPKPESTSMTPIRGLRAVVDLPMQPARRRARPGKRERARMKIAGPNQKTRRIVALPYRTGVASETRTESRVFRQCLSLLELIQP